MSYTILLLNEEEYIIQMQLLLVATASHDADLPKCKQAALRLKTQRFCMDFDIQRG